LICIVLVGFFAFNAISGDDDSGLIDTSFGVFTGTLKSLGGIKVSDNATHILELKDGSVVYVYSDIYDLDLEKYIGKDVEIYGQVTEATDKGKDVINITSIHILEEDESETEEIKEQLYSDQDVGFSWEIMSDWEIDHGDNNVAFILPLKDEESSLANDYISVIVYYNPNGYDLTGWLTDFTSEVDSQGADESVIGAESVSALKLTSQLGDSVSYYVMRSDGEVYEFTHYNYDATNRTYYRNLFNQSLATFKLIPLGDGYGATDLETTDEEEDVEEDDIDNDEENYDDIVSAIGENIGELAPEDATLGGTWYTTRIEFAEPNYAYAEYEDGHDMRRILMIYVTDPGFDAEVIAYFEPGDLTTWGLVSGNDEAIGLPKTVVTVEDGQVGSTVEVMEGYRYFESYPYEFSMQYPSSWYYSGGSGHYGFTEDIDSAEAVGLDILSESIDEHDGTSIELANGKKAFSVSEDGKYGIYVERDESSCFYVEGDVGYEEIVVNMAGSID